MIHDLQLESHGFGLEPLQLRHSADLAPLVDAEMWAGMTSPLPDTESSMRAYVEAAHKDPTRMAFAVIDHADGRAIGSTSFYELVRSAQRIEIGHTFYARNRWGTGANPSAKLMLLRHAFDELGLHRVALRCDSRNARSAAAIKRLGATAEGVLRGHRMRPDGTHGDTAYFSILAPEWPAVRAGLHDRLVGLRN